jgi:hypothetical protein
MASKYTMTGYPSIEIRVARRFAFKYGPKETQQNKIDKAKKLIADKAKISNGVAGAIADALIRGRDVVRLAIQKGWPIDEDGIINGKLDLREVPV